MKIYIITGRKFSNYRYEFHVITVFKKRKNAKDFLRKFKDIKIKEFEFIDDKFPKIHHFIKKRIFFVKMDRNGNVILIVESNDYDWFMRALKEHIKFISKQKMFYTYVFANNKKDAIKIVNEKRIQLITENNWIK